MFKVNDRVFNKKFGIGNIIHILDDDEYGYAVKFDNYHKSLHDLGIYGALKVEVGHGGWFNENQLTLVKEKEMDDKLEKIKEDLVKNGITAEQIHGLADMVEELRKDVPVIPKEGAWCAFSDECENPLDDPDVMIKKFYRHQPGEEFTYIAENRSGWRYCIEIEPPRVKWHWQKPDENTPVDTPVWVRDANYGEWDFRYLSNEKGRCWFDGKTSKEEFLTNHWVKIVLADPNDLGRRPPMDLEV